jgi:hypothetical protein
MNWPKNQISRHLYAKALFTENRCADSILLDGWQHFIYDACCTGFIERLSALSQDGAGGDRAWFLMLIHFSYRQIQNGVNYE